MVKSVVETSDADVAVYIDDDQVDLYRQEFDWRAEFGSRVLFDSGNRIGPAPAVNRLVERHGGYDVYGLSTDDSIYRTKGWDRFTADQISRFPGRIGAVSAYHGHGPWVNFPYVSSNWVETLGWFACPDVTHYCWDTAIEILGDATSIVYATREQFEIDHQPQPTSNIDRFALDGTLFLDWCIHKRPESIKRLRAMAGNPVETA
jgi:hypothetical protein